MKPLPYDKVKQLIAGERVVQTPTGRATFKLEERVGSYVVSGILHRGQTYTWEVKTDELLGEKEPKTLDEWIQHNEKAREMNEFGVLSAPQYHSLFSALYEHRNDEQHKYAIEQLRCELNSKLIGMLICTMSKVNYVPQGLDTVTHNIGMTDEYTSQHYVAGGIDFLTMLQDGSVYSEAIVGDNYSSKVNEIYEWLSGKKAYVYRVNNKLEQVDERMVALGVYYYDWFSLDAICNLGHNRPALGVRPARNSSTRGSS